MLLIRRRQLARDSYPAAPSPQQKRVRTPLNPRARPDSLLLSIPHTPIYIRGKRGRSSALFFPGSFVPAFFVGELLLAFVVQLVFGLNHITNSKDCAFRLKFNNGYLRFDVCCFHLCLNLYLLCRQLLYENLLAVNDVDALLCYTEVNAAAIQVVGCRGSSGVGNSRRYCGDVSSELIKGESFKLSYCH